MKNLKTKIIISICIAAIIYLAFSIYIDFDNLITAFKMFNFLWLPLLFLLSFLNYYIRFERWDYYLRILKLSMPRKVSFLIFFAGLVMSITPGKFGEVLKSYLIKEYNGTQIHTTAPIILVERLVDFISLLIVAMIGALLFDFGKNIVLFTMIFFFIILIILSWHNVTIKILNFLFKFKPLNKISEKVITSYENSYALIRPLPLFTMLFVTLIAWGFEGFELYLILKIFNTSATVDWSIFIYSFSTIVGALTLLPGGIGSTEGSLTYLLVRTKIPLNVSFVATFLVRIATLWFAIILGLISLIIFQKFISHKKVFQLEEN